MTPTWRCWSSRLGWLVLSLERQGRAWQWVLCVPSDVTGRAVRCRRVVGRATSETPSGPVRKAVARALAELGQPVPTQPDVVATMAGEQVRVSSAGLVASVAAPRWQGWQVAAGFGDYADAWDRALDEISTAAAWVA